MKVKLLLFLGLCIALSGCGEGEPSSQGSSGGDKVKKAVQEAKKYAEEAQKAAKSADAAQKAAEKARDEANEAAAKAGKDGGGGGGGGGKGLDADKEAQIKVLEEDVKNKLEIADDAEKVEKAAEAKAKAADQAAQGKEETDPETAFNVAAQEEWRLAQNKAMKAGLDLQAAENALNDAKAGKAAP